MKTVNIQAAKTHLSRLVEEVLAGEEITIAKAGKPLVRLVPYKTHGTIRQGGQYAGQIWEAPDCWSDEDELADSINTPLYLQSEGETQAGATVSIKAAESTDS